MTYDSGNEEPHFRGEQTERGGYIIDSIPLHGFRVGKIKNPKTKAINLHLLLVEENENGEMGDEHSFWLPEQTANNLIRELNNLNPNVKPFSAYIRT